MADTNAPTAPVKDPQPSVDRIEDLARRILHGDILLPKFQRAFVWERKQILSLLDSVAKGYPIGSILLWQSRQELMSENRIADLEIKLPKPDYPVNYLLDGQQRLSTICGALYWKGDDPESHWNIAYDLRDKKFVHLDTLEDPAPHQIRVSKLSDPAAFFKHVYALDTLTAPDRDQLKVNADTLFNRFKDYKIAAVTLGDMSIQDVAPIFERINSEGTRLTVVDLMRAATWSKDFDLVDSIDGILEDLTEKNFEEIDRKVVLRNVSASVGGGFSAESIDKLRNHTSAELKEAVAATREAYKRAVDYLVTQIRIPDARVLPYAHQMTVLVEIFRRIPSPSATQFREIESMFWKTALSGYFSGWNTGSMARDQIAVHEFAEGKAPTLGFDFHDPSHTIWKSRTFRSNNAHSKTFAIILSHYGPVDLLTGQKIDTSSALSWTNQKEFHHFFPRKYLESCGEKADRINALANIVLLTSASNKTISASKPSIYLKEVEKAAGPSLAQWLDSNLIPMSAFKAGLKNDFDGFLEERAKAIHAAIQAKIH
ncbi:GmrSD restriction endonuclease domain-containing protein [Archangium violaceum]|uniref:GmrSD restriction endonuclease domain-containing protein n=1 Tax=Archangium violaceum TaxID=83451 RepID=UPI00094986FD|nr:DUF262 domain-containing protein [Archangium violaceum]